MAQYIAEVQGQAGAAHRLGSKCSGARAHVRGWDCGIQVVAWYDEATGQDRFRIAVDSGSNGNGRTRILADVCENGEVVFDPFRDIAEVGE